MRYGHFSSDGREYVIDDPRTPRPWFNYLFNRKYHALVSQTGGGFSYYKDPKVNRILRYEHIHTDRPGRYVFLRDEDTGEVWSANWQPLKSKLDSWQCRHGLGYSVISSGYKGIKCELTYFVHVSEPVEFRKVKIKNDSARSRTLKVFPFAELVAGNIELENNYRNILCLYNEAYFDKTLNGIVAFKHPFKKEHRVLYSYLGMSGKADAYDCNKEKFYGRYNDSREAEALTSGRLRNRGVRGEDMVAVLEKKITLKPGEEKEIVVVLGVAEDKKGLKKLAKFQKIKAADDSLKAVKRFWEDALGNIVVKTPDADFDLMTNIWGRYQLYAITCWRGTSQYHGGEGGLGYRDTAQDIEGLLALDMDLAMEKLGKILYYQYNSGHAVSGFSDIEGSWDKASGSMVIGKADVAVWLVYTVVSYLKETGDFGFLKKVYSFHDGGKATVYEHVLRVVRYLFDQRGKHGLPFIKKADWNDAYDAVGIKGKGESVWLGMALARACTQMGSLAGYLGDKKVAEEMKRKYEVLYKTINKVAWDGQWYLAAFNDEGYKIGSSKNKEGKVPLNSQTWAILGEVAPKERLKKILNKIDDYLDTKYGPALFLPSYTKFNPAIGRVTAFAAGTKENAAIFSHACAFKIVADCMIGRGDKAFETYKKLCPMNKAKDDHDKYKVEPYVWAEYVIGPGNKDNFGEGSFTWNTGTAPWMFMAACEWMLGARREFGGLLIDPCIPGHWKRCSIKRPFRGATYLIEIENPDGVQRGVKKISVDGREIKGNIVRPRGDGKTHKVEVVMGK